MLFLQKYGISGNVLEAYKVLFVYHLKGAKV